jgi:hypothetical protein
MGSPQAQHKLGKGIVASVRQSSKKREGGQAGGKSVYKSKIATHETKVALLVEVIDGGGGFSVGLEEDELEDAEAPLSRLVEVTEGSEEDGWVRSRELLPGVLERLAERKAGDGAANAGE